MNLENQVAVLLVFNPTVLETNQIVQRGHRTDLVFYKYETHASDD